MLSVVMLIVIMLSFVMLSVVMLNVIMLRVEAPSIQLFSLIIYPVSKKARVFFPHRSDILRKGSNLACKF
jgi:hypothetical protein